MVAPICCCDCCPNIRYGVYSFDDEYRTYFQGDNTPSGHSTIDLFEHARVDGYYSPLTSVSPYPFDDIFYDDSDSNEDVSYYLDYLRFLAAKTIYVDVISAKLDCKIFLEGFYQSDPFRIDDDSLIEISELLFDETLFDSIDNFSRKVYYDSCVSIASYIYSKILEFAPFVNQRFLNEYNRLSSITKNVVIDGYPVVQGALIFCRFYLRIECSFSFSYVEQ
ncbi:hypothetical protein [Campylobacter hyointestinalis]|uniref:hypothetical protein n=1 Tax=Campylobacter hyointestinalis TaxID=198 RepID=UPI000DCBF80B|nr:hypothetical protein [Campylobacter hyointestinalis]RAZ57421.1 hypothetical protein CHL10074_00250 [Campylobacter hyointestinalis subsp. lawsonii]RAZ64976.1 hypothetical protein CHL9767_01915 [Campylobacter hyointestinalis subsp. lawsonii]